MDNEKVENKTGDWYFGVVVLKNPNHPSVLNESCSGLSKSDFSDSFGFKSYDLRIFTGGEAETELFFSLLLFSSLILSGCYYFNSSSEEWDGRGVSVLFKDNVRIWTQCQTNHLSSYGTGFFKTVNAIDFEFIFAEFDYADHVTIFIVLLVTIILFLITLIWSQIHDFL